VEDPARTPVHVASDVMRMVGVRPDPEPQAYRPGSPEDFDRLYRNAYPRVFRTLTAILRDPDEAEDCAQDAFVEAFKAWRRWRPDAPAEAWIHRIAVNKAISFRRKARLRSAGELLRRLGRPGHGADPADVATQPDLLGALRSIHPRLSAAIVLRHYHGFNNREIAAALGVSERTVGARLRQASEKLRGLIGDFPRSDFSLEATGALSRKEGKSSNADR
jgi:RNA polymerase sigma-70 factor (ECF subfamily)